VSRLPTGVDKQSIDAITRYRLSNLGHFRYGHLAVDNLYTPAGHSWSVMNNDKLRYSSGGYSMVYRGIVST